MAIEENLNEKAKFYAKYLWNMELNIPVKINKRFTKSLGRCVADKIELAPYILQDAEVTDDTLLHELCHWYCRQIGEKYNDGTKFFEDELDRIGASSTCTTTIENGRPMFIYQYGCYDCEKCKKGIETKEYRHEKTEVGWTFKEKHCCGEKMKFSGIKYVKEKFVENHKLQLINQAFRRHMTHRTNE